VDTCTVAALDVITAFAVPNPNCPSQDHRFFQVWSPYKLPCRADHPAYFGLASFISPILSAVDVSETKQLLHRCQRNYRCNHEISVNGIVENRVLCTFPLPQQNQRS